MHKQEIQIVQVYREANQLVDTITKDTFKNKNKVKCNNHIQLLLIAKKVLITEKR